MSIVKWSSHLTEAQELALFKAVSEIKRAGFGEVVIKVDRGKIRFFVTRSERLADDG